MGQRLVIQIKKGDEVLANAYYHWSGYTGSAIETLKEAVAYYHENNQKLNDIELAIGMLQTTGAGCAGDKKYAKELVSKGFKLNDCLSRNHGIIAVSPDGKKENLSWSEMTLDVYFDRKEADLTNLFTVISKEEYEEWYDKKFDESKKLKIKVDLENVRLEDIDDEFIGFIEDLPHEWYDEIDEKVVLKIE